MITVRRSLAVSAMCSAVLAAGASPAAAKVALVNPGFEAGTTAGWQGTGVATDAYAGYTPRDGTHFGLVRSPGCPGEQLVQTFTAAAGDVLSGWAFFTTGDMLPFDDEGSVRIVVAGGASTAVLFRSSVGEVGGGGGTPWQSFSYAFGADGSYTLEVHVDNALDCGEASAVGIDFPESPASVADADGDGVLDETDNCPQLANADQRDDDDDGVGNACDDAMDSNRGKATGGGWLVDGDRRISFSVSANGARGGASGTCTITFARTKIRCVGVDGFHVSASEDRVVIVGDAVADGVSTRYRIVLRDNGEPGRNDRLAFAQSHRLGAGVVRGIERAGADPGVRLLGVRRMVAR